MTPSFKDFPHHGMIGDFNDAKLLTVKGIVHPAAGGWRRRE